MSMRLVTTPWLTKNFAGVALDTGGLLRCAGWGGALPGLDRRIVPHARPGITAPLRSRRPSTASPERRSAPPIVRIRTAPEVTFVALDSPNSHGAGNHLRRTRSSECGFRIRNIWVK